MRLWHEALIQKLPRQQLLGQHRECAALRGNGWGRKHATVNYVFQHSPYKLFQFHMLVMDEMERRGYHPDQNWRKPEYRGKTCPAYQELTPCALTKPIYPEHNATYLQLCERLLAERT
ncbi:TIGR02328 family protein [Fructilactobacillus cliffordii]|uniref:TIGR02328 family protein n=1 Tax=Fructilactobacillus cliffordii TaxID=2940299 RepID=A0A9Q9E2Q9_9LACO|nr:TIGR02328 family protein [Fructilactobacillus cliffordii]USS89059.1 TIGR02328 family protein [Fructilactobacillus cliffordii]